MLTPWASFARTDVPPGLWVANAGATAALGIRTFAQLLTPGLSWRNELLRQFVFAFRVTLVPASIVAFVVGFGTIGIMGGSLASAFGAVDRVAPVAPLVFLRELGPLLTTSIVAGTLGATITAELGARKIREELVALEVLGINPVRNLVLPRVVGPDAVDAGARAADLLGGDRRHVHRDGPPLRRHSAGVRRPAARADQLHRPVGQRRQARAVRRADRIIAAQKGLQVSGGAEGVGRAVNESVVTCFVAIGIVTVAYTQLFQAFFPEVNFGG